jgi:hypothetical protein
MEDSRTASAASGGDDLAAIGMSQAQITAEMAARRLILHFDINKSIIMSDIGAGVSNKEMLNSLLSECVFGYIKENTRKETRGAFEWILVSEYPSTTPPPDSGKTLLTFGDYLENHTTLTKAQRVPFKRTFTAIGGIGEKFKGFVDEMCRCLTPPQEAIIQANETGLNFFSNGSYHIIPAFFNLIVELDKRCWDFHIVFRTFGEDSARVAEEFNAFCNGAHPCYPHIKMNGEHNRVDRRLQLPMKSGCLRRVSSDSKGVLFASVNENQVFVPLILMFFEYSL